MLNFPFFFPARPAHRIGSTFCVGRESVRSAGDRNMWEHRHEAVVCEANQEIGTHRKGFPVRIEFFRPVNRWFMTISVSQPAVYASVRNRFQSSLLCRQKCFPLQRENRKPRRQVAARHQRNSDRVGGIREVGWEIRVNSRGRRTFRSAQRQTRQDFRLGLQLAPSTRHRRFVQSSTRTRCFLHDRGRRGDKVHGMREAVDMCCDGWVWNLFWQLWGLNLCIFLIFVLR